MMETEWGEQIGSLGEDLRRKCDTEEAELVTLGWAGLDAELWSGREGMMAMVEG